jgi:hypothetical protein
MSETQVVGVRRSRRSRAAIEHLVGEFIESGMGQREFCRVRGVSLKTLKRYLENPRGKAGTGYGGLIAVELAAVSPAPQHRWESYLSVVVSSGRRIEVGSGFDAATLAQLVTVLERL